jgi:hypothetical protein
MALLIQLALAAAAVLRPLLAVAASLRGEANAANKPNRCPVHSRIAKSSKHHTMRCNTAQTADTLGMAYYSHALHPQRTKTNISVWHNATACIQTSMSVSTSPLRSNTQVTRRQPLRQVIAPRARKVSTSHSVLQIPLRLNTNSPAHLSNMSWQQDCCHTSHMHPSTQFMYLTR